MNDKPRIGRYMGMRDGKPVYQVAIGESQPAPAKRFKTQDGRAVFARFKRDIDTNSIHLGRRVPDQDNRPCYFVENGTDSPPNPGIKTPCCTNRIPLTLRWFWYSTTYPSTMPGSGATPTYTLNWTSGHTWSFTNSNPANPNIAEEHREVRCDGALLGFGASGYTTFTPAGGGGTTAHLYIRVDNKCSPFKLIFQQNFASSPPQYHLIIP